GPDGTRRRDWLNPNSKNQQALRTLRELLLGIPEGTPISLRLFGYKHDDRAKDGMSEEELTVLTLDELIYRGNVNWSRANPKPLQDAILSRLEIEPKWY